MVDTVIQNDNDKNSLFRNVLNGVTKIKQKLDNLGNRFKRITPLEDITKPTIEVFISSIERDIVTGDRWLRKKFWIKNNQLHFYDRRGREGDDEGWNDFYENSSEIAILGFQVETASIYGRKMELSILEYKDLIWNNINTGDIIMVRTYLAGEEEEYNYTFEDYLDGDMTEEEMLHAVEELDFSGIITTKNKSMASSEQFRLEAVDLVKILQQLNISIGRSLIKFINNEGREEETNFQKSDLGSLLINAFYQELNDSDTNERGLISRDGDLKNRGKRFLFGEPKEFSQVINDFAFASANNFNQSYIIRLDNNESSKKFVIYLNLLTPVVAVKLIVNHALKSIGFHNFMSVGFSDTIADYFIKDTEILFKEKNVPFIILATYFYDYNKTLDFEKNTINTIIDVTDKLMFYNFNDVMFFEGLEAGSIMKTLENKAYFLHDDVGKIYKHINNIDVDMGLFVSDVRHSFKGNYTGNNAKIFEDLSKFRFNNFFDTMNTSRIAIRSSAQKIEKGAEGINQSIPLSQLIYYAYSLYNYTPVFNDVFKDNFERKDIREFDSNNYLHSISQVTWFTSIFVNQQDNFQFVIYPICTPFKYQNSPKHAKRGEMAYFNNVDALEMEFKQLELNNKVLFIHDELQAGIGLGLNEYITLKTDEYDHRDRTKVDIFGDQNLNLTDYTKDKFNILKAFSRETLYDSVDNQDYIEKYQPHMMRVFMGSDAKRHVVLKDEVYPATIKNIIHHKLDPITTEGQAFAVGNYIPYNMVSWDEEEGKMDVEMNRNKTPLFFARGKLKNGIERDITDYYFITDGAGSASDFEMLPYKVNYTFERDDEGAGTTDKIQEQYSTNFVITGVKSYIELDKLAKGLEFLFTKNIVPADLRENIRFSMLPINTTTFQFQLLNVEKTVDQMVKYIQDIITQIKKENNNQNLLPYEIWIQPDIGDIYDNMKAFYTNTFETSDQMPNPEQDKIVERCISFLRKIINKPVLFTEDWSPKNINLQDDRRWGKDFSPEFMEDDDTNTDHLNFNLIHRGIQEILKWIYAYEVFVQDILRKTYENGSLYLANQGYTKLDIGQYIKLVDNRERFHIIDDPTFLTDLKKVLRHIKVLKTEPDVNERGAKRTKEDIFSDNHNAIYYSSSNPSIATKPFAWFVWKTITYMGDSSGGGGGTSGYTQKVYLTRDGVNFSEFFEEKNFITALASQLGDRGFGVIVPPPLIGT